jgi:hypothetical protein
MTYHRLTIVFNFNLHRPQVIIELIANTTTATGLRVQAELDTNCYQTGIRITKKQLDTVNLYPADFHGDWNYSIRPSTAMA